MKPYKYNKDYATRAQILHDMFWSTCSTLISSAWEVFVLWAWATKRIALNSAAAEGAEWYTDKFTVAWVILMPYIRCVFRAREGMGK